MVIQVQVKIREGEGFGGSGMCKIKRLERKDCMGCRSGVVRKDVDSLGEGHVTDSQPRMAG